MMSGKMYRFRVPSEYVDPRFLEAYFQTAEARDLIDRMKTGGSDSGLNLTQSRFLQLPVPVAPRNEQRRIVELYEELASDIEAGAAALQRARSELGPYQASILKAAVEGELSAEWRAHHVYSESLDLEKTLLEARRKEWAQNATRHESGQRGRRLSYAEPRAAHGSDLPKLPHGWHWFSLDQLIREPLRNGHSSPVTRTGHGVATFSLTAVTTGDFSDSNIKLTSADPIKVEQLWVEKDDIFIQRANTPELVGTARRYRGEAKRAIFPDLLIRVRLVANVLPAYVEIALQSARAKTYFRKRARGIAGSMPKIDQEVVQLTPIPVAPPAEQQYIVDAVEDQLSVVEHLQQTLDARIVSARALRLSLLRDAFAGKLVAQDLKDDPASTLIEHITRLQSADNGKHKPRREARNRRHTKKRASSMGA
jgi:type I restriction enzyme S subunit